ncbi:MAG: hypothetical protein AAF456_12055 [Planctomycetota bacterium]
MLKNPKKTGICQLRISTLLPSLAIALFVLTASTLTAQAQSNSHDVVVRFDRNVYLQFASSYRHSGDLLIVEDFEQPDATRKMPIEVTAAVHFGQRFSGSDSDMQAIRWYEGTEADFQIDSGTETLAIEGERSLILARIKQDSDKRFQLAGVADYLTQTEVDLIRNSADPLSFPALFTKNAVEVGESWQPEDDALADFLAVDRVYSNETELTLSSVSDGVARVQLTGSAKAEVDDVTSEIVVQTVAWVNLENEFVEALRSEVRQQREPGQIAAGYTGITRVDMKSSIEEEIPSLTNEALANVASQKVERKLKWESRVGGFELIYDTRWRMIVADTEAAVMRFVDNGNLMAQCNVVQLPARPQNRPLALEEFRTEVARVVAQEESAQVIAAETKRTQHGLAALRVTVEGVEQGVPVQWIYYHVSGEDGRCATFVFTLEQELASIFAPADKLLVNQFEFTPLNSDRTGRYFRPSAPTTGR